MQFTYETQDTTKKLSDKASDLIASIPTKYTAWHDDRQPQIDDAVKIRQAVYQKTVTNKSKQWNSNFKIADLFRIKQVLKAHIWENIYQKPENMFDVEGLDQVSEQNEQAQKAMLVDSFKNMKVQKQLDKSIDDMIDVGDSVLFVGWETKVKEIRRQKTFFEKAQEKFQKMYELLFSDVTIAKTKFQELLAKPDKYVISQQVVYDGARVKRIDPLSFVYDVTQDPNTTSCPKIYRDFFTPQQLKENKLYKIPDLEELKNIASDSDNPDRDSSELKTEDDTDIAKNGQVEVLEYWGDIKLEDGTILKNWLIVIAARKQVIRFEANPYVICPFISTNLIEDPDTKRGISILKYALEQSELKSEILNKKIDALALNINPAYLAPNGAFSGNQELEPGKIVEYDPALMPERPTQIIVNAEAGWDFLQFIDSIIEATTGVYANMNGDIEQNGTTATEIKARVSGQNSRQSMIIDTINQNLIIPMVEAVADITANYKFGDETLKGNIKGQSQFININDEVRQGNYKYNYVDSTALQSDRLMIQEILPIAKEFFMNPEVQAVYSPADFFELIMQKFGFEDLEKIKRDTSMMGGMPNVDPGTEMPVEDMVNSGQLPVDAGGY